MVTEGMMDAMMVFAVVMGIVCMLAGARIAYGKGRSAQLGAVLGLVLGVLGLVIVLLLPRKAPPVRRARSRAF